MHRRISDTACFLSVFKNFSKGHIYLRSIRNTLSTMEIFLHHHYSMSVRQHHLSKQLRGTLLGWDVLYYPFYHSLMLANLRNWYLEIEWETETHFDGQGLIRFFDIFYFIWNFIQCEKLRTWIPTARVSLFELLIFNIMILECVVKTENKILFSWYLRLNILEILNLYS